METGIAVCRIWKKAARWGRKTTLGWLALMGFATLAAQFFLPLRRVQFSISIAQMAIWTDDQLIAAIRAGGPQFNQAVEYMYKKWNGYFVGYVIKNGGSKHEADDAFSHAAIDVIKQVRKDEFSLVSASFRTYFMTSFIRHWVRLYRNGKRPPLLEIDEEIIQIENLNPEEELIKKDRAERVRRALEGIGGRCIKIWLLYAAGYSWEKIAECLNIDIQTAKNQWGTCKKKLRDILLGDI